MSDKKVILSVNVPDGVTNDELNQFLLFKYMGHCIRGDVLSKFDYEELDVNYFEVET